MPTQKRLKSLSRTTCGFLASGEGQAVDFKRTPDSISAEDLVAFANTEMGGCILAGVGETSVAGAQGGIVVGCDVSDNTILQLLNKAISCLPPVSIDIIIENLSEKPILRLVIPPSPTRPHCTPKGVYSRRDGARNRALHPSELLKIFLESEGKVFAERFESAAANISEEIESLEDSLSATIRNMSNELGWAQSNLDDTSSTIDTVLAYAKLINDEAIDIGDRLRALFRQDERKDPVRDRELEKVTELLVEQISEDKKILQAILAKKELIYKLQGKSARELTAEDGQKALAKASEIVREREDLKNYKAKLIAPGEHPDARIDLIAAAIAGDHDPSPVVRELRGAYRLAYTEYNGSVVAVAGLGKPRADSRARLFRRMNSPANSKVHQVRLDWLFLHPDHRNKGQLSKLVKKLISLVKDRSMFATAEHDNLPAREVLAQFGFHPSNIIDKASEEAPPARVLYLREV